MSGTLVTELHVVVHVYGTVMYVTVTGLDLKRESELVYMHFTPLLRAFKIYQHKTKQHICFVALACCFFITCVF